jgi:hypothetical protein
MDRIVVTAKRRSGKSVIWVEVQGGHEVHPYKRPMLHSALRLWGRRRAADFMSALEVSSRER